MRILKNLEVNPGGHVNPRGGICTTRLKNNKLRKKKKKANDACARKVKARYKVWPSAYASGAVAKCRKVGAKNWGNSKK